MTRGDLADPVPVCDAAEWDAIRRGDRLAPGEPVVWRGAPPVRLVARDVFHVRLLLGYCALLLAVDAAQAWRKGLPLARAAHDSVPLVLALVLALAIIGALAVAMARTTRYTITDRRVILRYGIALPAVLSLPFAQVATCAAAVRADRSGDIALVLKAGNRMPFLKLWPLARAWHLQAPQPTLRAVPRAAAVAGLLVRPLRPAQRG